MIKKLVVWIVKKIPYIKHKFIQKYITNTKPSKKDSRDYIMASSPSSLPFPYSYTLTNIPPVRNQGSLGSCRAFSIIREYEIQLNTKKLAVGTFDGSELFHYYMTRKYVNNTFPKDKGMTMRDGCITALKFGVAAESLHPYSVQDLNKEPDAFAKGLADLFRIQRYEKLNNPDDIKTSVLEGVPVGIGIWCDDDFFRYRSGVWNPQTKGKYGHAVTVVGWNEDGFIIDNSWGNSWGRNGQFVMSYEAFNKFSFDWYRMIL